MSSSGRVPNEGVHTMDRQKFDDAFSAVIESIRASGVELHESVVLEAHGAYDDAMAGLEDARDDWDRDDTWDDPMDAGDGTRFADPTGVSALRAAGPGNPRNCACPTCGGRNRLTPADVARGYQCDSCANRTERGWEY